MKLFRVLLLVVLALTLPVRGVMAAAMLCPPPAGAAGHGHATRAAASHHEHEHAEGASHHHAKAGTSAAGHHHDGVSGTDTCNLCSACCSVPPVRSAAPALPVPYELAGSTFPAYSVPAPSFLSDGQERPPRSI